MRSFLYATFLVYARSYRVYLFRVLVGRLFAEVRVRLTEGACRVAGHVRIYRSFATLCEGAAMGLGMQTGGLLLELRRTWVCLDLDLGCLRCR